jgi:hypothetical protein
MSSSGCFNCHVPEATLRTFPYECRPRIKYNIAPYTSSFDLSLCDFCYQYACDNSSFPLFGRDEYDAWDSLVFPEENTDNEFFGTQPLSEDDDSEPFYDTSNPGLMNNLVRQFDSMIDENAEDDDSEPFYDTSNPGLMNNLVRQFDSIPNEFEDIVGDTECIVCWNTEECSSHPVRYTLLRDFFVHPIIRDFLFCKECLSRVSNEDFSQVICTDDDDLLDNHIAPLF